MKSPEELFYDGLATKKEQTAKPLSEPISPSRQISSKSIFSNPETHPMVLDLALIKKFELEWFSWLPETLFQEIEKTFSTSIAEVNRLKILATQTLHVTDSFWDHWEIFEKTVVALNSIIPLAHIAQPLDLPLLYAGVDMANQLRTEDFNEEVSRYCAAVFLYENVHYAPEPLDFCQQYITQPMYHCKDCDKRASSLPPFDGLCSSCAGHFTHANPLSFKPDPEAVSQGKGKNLEFYSTYDSKPIQARFEVLDKMQAAELNKALRETAEDVQSARLIAAMDYKNHRAQQLRDQLAALRGWLEAT